MLYAWSTILDAVREFCAALFYKFEITFLAFPICILGLNGFVQFAAMIMNHVYRLGHGGKVCSGDYLDATQKADPANALAYMFSRGTFLWALLIIYWVVMGLVCCACCVAVTVMVGAMRK